MNAAKPLVGNWRIVEMEAWGREYIDREGKAYIRILPDGTGRFQFGLVKGYMDGRMETRGDTVRFEFSWSGRDEMDETGGRGWALTGDDELRGRIYFHRGDDSASGIMPSKEPLPLMTRPSNS